MLQRPERARSACPLNSPDPTPRPDTAGALPAPGLALLDAPDAARNPVSRVREARWYWGARLTAPPLPFLSRLAGG